MSCRRCQDSLKLWQPNHEKLDQAIEALKKEITHLKFSIPDPANSVTASNFRSAAIARVQEGKEGKVGGAVVKFPPVVISRP